MTAPRPLDPVDFDRRHIWHPYTSAVNPLPASLVESAAGVRLRLADGREAIDGMSSWWCAIHGYNHPVLNRAVSDQTARMAHVMFGGLTHTPAVDMCRLLLEITPDELDVVFPADSGSVAVEVAIKMALQFMQAAGRKRRTRLMTVRGGYHGDTFAAMSVCDPVNGMHGLFRNVLPEQVFAARPACPFGTGCSEEQFANFRQHFLANRDELAAVILEPILQGAGGMHLYDPEFLRRVRALCDEFDVLLIFDEIATGFGRTGTLFACDRAGVCPDILCVGKALTGGYMTLAAVLATRRVAEGISRDGGVLMHGPTFMANPLACAVAAASMRLLLDSPWQRRVADIEAELRAGLAPLQGTPLVADVRVLGAVGVVEMKEPVNVPETQRFLLDRGVWLRPFGKLLYTMPPYIIDNTDLRRLITAMRDAALNADTAAGR